MITGSGVNIRKGPGTNYAKQDAGLNSTMPAIARNADGSWYQLGNEQWSHAQ